MKIKQNKKKERFLKLRQYSAFVFIVVVLLATPTISAVPLVEGYLRGKNFIAENPSSKSTRCSKVIPLMH